ncbi:hypothetical protein [Dysosmobacter sp.]|uniref:hypothetical protein n=1 Tax=Dysosmobacter sp. TaxID=2591382 RepID=UPI002A887AA5|nr:hypothetical protein [Dysosmobacter sp.]MDY3281217.1 hypothetical protein [Dysosmobacter sp.]
MRHPQSFTAAVRAEIDRCVERQIANANEQLDRLQTAQELRRFLTDETKMATPGFVLRRYIQTRGKLPLPEECPDLSRGGNVPWTCQAVRQAAVELSVIGRERHGLGITPEAWERYLTADMPQGPQRETLFQLAVVAGMDRQATTELLMACGQPSYNLRSPLELICWFCQFLPGLYTWKDIRRLLEKYRECSAEAEQNPGGISRQEEPTGDTTRLISWSVDEILGTGDPPADAERELVELMVKNRGGMRGYSGTARKKYLRLLDYLTVLYRTNPHRLTSTMFKSQGWNFEDVFQTKTGPRYVFRGEEEEEGAPRQEDDRLDGAMGKIALFCKGYNKRISAIRNSSVRGGAEAEYWKAVQRWDILLLGYFLITGYMDAPEESRQAMWALTEKGGPMDRRMTLLRDDLSELGRECGLREKQVLCCRVLNELLAGFGFYSLYVPGPFDRFILLCLLTDQPAWTSRYLLRDPKLT